ncbi:MAG: hypothetical protein LBT02_01125, partial [Rickettsiales bacterium]|nr:hypothetical protein [Rickettsiales bacterium]
SSYKEYNDKKYDNKAKTDYWKDVIYIDAFPDTKKFITEVGIEKFKAIADLISGFKLDREFFGIDPLKEIYE